MRMTLSIIFISTALLGCTNNSEEPKQKSSLGIECYSRGYNDEYEVSAAVTEFSMYVMNGQNSYVNVLNPVQVEYSGNKWNFKEVKITDTLAEIYAFAPQSSATNPANIPLSLTPLTDYLVSDRYIATNKEPNISIDMNHILSKINVTIDGNKVTSLSVSGQPATGSYNLLTGEMTKSNSSDLISGKEYVYIFPSTTKLTFDIVYNGKSYTYNASSKEYQKGKEYSYKLKLDVSGNLTISGDVTVKPWEPAEDVNGSIQVGSWNIIDTNVTF